MARKKVIVEAGVVWNSIWSHSHEVAKALSQEYEVYYVEPVRTKAPHAHLKEKTEYPVPKHVTVVRHDRVLDDLSLDYLRYSEKDTLKIVKRIRPDFLLTYQCLLGLRAFKYAKRHGIKTIYMNIDDYFALSNSPLVKLYLLLAEPWMMRNANGILCTAKVLEERSKKYNKNVIYLPNGINIKELPKASRKKTKNVTVGFVGTLGNWVDVSWFAKIAEAFPNVTVTVIGGGEGMNVLKNTSFPNLKTPGFLPHKEAMKHVATFDIALIPFKVNRITHAVNPIKLFEYWSMRTAVVCARTKETEQFKGKLVFASAKDIVDKIRPLISDEALRKTYAERGHKSIPEYDWKNLGKRLRRFLSDT